jgi:hypothetical protein
MELESVGPDNRVIESKHTHNASITAAAKPIRHGSLDTLRGIAQFFVRPVRLLTAFDLDIRFFAVDTGQGCLNHDLHLTDRGGKTFRHHDSKGISRFRPVAGNIPAGAQGNEWHGVLPLADERGTPMATGLAGREYRCTSQFPQMASSGRKPSVENVSNRLPEFSPTNAQLGIQRIGGRNRPHPAASPQALAQLFFRRCYIKKKMISTTMNGAPSNHAISAGITTSWYS